MTAFADSDQAVPTSDERVLRAATAAYLGRYRAQSRLHTGSDLKIYLSWCVGHDLDPLRVGRPDIEHYVRWLQETRCYQPSTVSRRLSVVVGFYRTCVIDQILPFSPADYVRRPPMPAESPTLGLGHLQFEALITTARLSANINDFALIAMLGLLDRRRPAGVVTLSPDEDTDNHGESVRVTTLNIPEIDGRAFFGINFSWKPGSAIVEDGIGRRKMRIAYTTSHPALTEMDAYSLDIADPDDSLKDVGVEVEAYGKRVGEPIPDPDGRPDPQTVVWRVGNSQSEQYYVVTVEDPAVRFWVGLVNEQTLFIAGLLLGAVVGAIASDWITGRRTQ